MGKKEEVEKVSVFIKIRVLFWPEISALGVFFNFDNERMRPPPLNTQVPPLPPGLYTFPAGALRYRGGPHPRYVFRGRRGLF